MVASALAAAAVLTPFSIASTAAAAALACAFDPDFGAVLRAVLAGALAGALEADADALRFAGAFRFEAVDLDAEPGAFLAAGFLRPELDRDELDFERLLGFFGAATAAQLFRSPAGQAPVLRAAALFGGAGKTRGLQVVRRGGLGPGRAGG